MVEVEHHLHDRSALVNVVGLEPFCTPTRPLNTLQCHGARPYLTHPRPLQPCSAEERRHRTCMLVTLPTFHAFKGWLKALTCPNMSCATQWVGHS